MGWAVAPQESRGSQHDDAARQWSVPRTAHNGPGEERREPRHSVLDLDAKGFDRLPRPLRVVACRPLAAPRRMHDRDASGHKASSATTTATHVRHRAPIVMTESDVVAEVKAALAPMEVFVVARSAFGGLVAAVAVPPAERLQGSVAEFLKEQLRSARATASGARADRMAKALRKVGELEWALEQSGASRAPAVVSQVATTSTESVQVCEVTEAARLIDQIDPLWLSVLLPARLGGEVLYESEAWQSLRARAEAQLDAFVGEQLLRRCARAAFGRCKALLGKARDRKKQKQKIKTKKNEPQQEEEEAPEVPAAAPRGAPSPTEALAEWRAIVTLLCAAEAATVCSGHVVPAVPASVRSAFARQPKGVVGSGSQCKGEGVSCAEVAEQVVELEAEVVAEVEALCAAYWEAVEAAGAGGDAPAQKGRVLRRCDPNFKPNPNPNSNPNPNPDPNPHPHPHSRPHPHPHPHSHPHPHHHPNQVRAARGLARCPGGAARGRPHAADRAATRAASRAAACAAA